jgi:antitoxin component YwqK of YwqJK toxin-antitoxin module
MKKINTFGLGSFTTLLILGVMGFPLWVYFFGDGSLPSIKYLFFSFIIFGVILLLIISNLNLLVGSYNSSTEEVIKSEPSEEKIKDGPSEEEIKDGPFEEFYPNERLKLRGFYLNGKRDGDWEFFDEYEGGDLLVTGKYKDGIKEGIWKEYHRSDKGLHFQESYMDGKILDGSWESYHYNGKIKSKGYYYKGKKHGLWESFDENGTLKISGSFKNGSRDGVFNQYYPHGSLRIKCVFYTPVHVDYESFHSTSKNVISTKGNIRNGKKDGIWKEYDKNGVLINETLFNDGSYKVNKFFSKDELTRWEFVLDDEFDFIDTVTKYKKFEL